MLTAKISTKGQIDPDVIVMRKVAQRPNEGLVDALLGCPHRFEIPKPRREYPKKIEL
jgi:hypothetical protein